MLMALYGVIALACASFPFLLRLSARLGETELTDRPMLPLSHSLGLINTPSPVLQRHEPRTYSTSPVYALPHSPSPPTRSLPLLFIAPPPSLALAPAQMSGRLLICPFAMMHAYAQSRQTSASAEVGGARGGGGGGKGGSA